MADELPQPEPQPTPTVRPWYVKLLPTNWRSFVVWVVMASSAAVYNSCRGPNDEPLPIPEPPVPVWPDGWFKPDPEDTQNVLALKGVWRFEDTEAGAMVGADDDAPVWRFYAKVHGHAFPARNQGEVGSCVSFGFSGAVEMSLAAQLILKRGPPQTPVHDVVQEIIYAGSRVEVNGGRVPFVGDGSTGAWAVKWLSTGGIIARGKYGSLDLSEYSVERCRTWGDKGVPTELKPDAKKNLCTYALVKSAAAAKKALQQGYPIAVCSNQGFQNTRDNDGFLQPQGNWGHCMLIAGYRNDRAGFLIANSWGPDWVKGPKGQFADIPDGSFWAESAVVDRMLKQEDSFAISGVSGFKKAKIPPEDWIVVRPQQPRRFDHVFALAP